MNNSGITVIRHNKERLNKCSLQSLQGHPDITFFKYTEGFHFDATGFIVLSLNAPILSIADKGHSLLILDSTWRLLPKLENCLTGVPIRRSLPKGIKTSYPRVSKITEDPLGGLASIEALFLAKKILGENDESLLAGYYWKDLFLSHLKKFHL